MKFEAKVLILAVLAAAGLWALDSLLQQPISLGDSLAMRLLTGGSAQRLGFRIAMTVTVVGLGVAGALYVRRRRRTKEALRAGEGGYRDIVEGQAELICRLRPSGEIIYVNEAYCRYFGLTRKDLFGRKIAPHLPRESPGRTCSGLASLTREHPADTHEHTVAAPDGRMRYQQWSSRAVFDETGVLVEYQCVGRDITEQKLAEQALREQRDRAQTYLDIAGVIFVAIDVKGTVTMVNPRGCQVLGYDRQEIIGRNWFDSFVPDHIRNNTRQVFLQIMRGDLDPVEYYENPVLVRGGQERIIAWHNTFLREGGAIVGTLSSGEDVTERRQAEQDLRLQRDFAESLVETAQALVVVTDLEGRLVRLNRFAHQSMGYSEAEVIGADLLAAAVAPDDIALARDCLERAKAGLPVPGEAVRMVAKDGRELLVRWYLASLRDANGKITAVLGIGHDVTEIRQKEAQLRQAVKMEAIGRLVGGIAHDFNNMLAIIQGYADMMLTSMPADNEQRVDVEKIRAAAARAAALTRQLLVFARRQPSHTRVVSLNETIAAMDAMLRPIIGEDIALEIRPAADLHLVRTDPAQIEQVLMNLVVNAREAMPEGGKLVIETANATLPADPTVPAPGGEAGEYAMLAVSDTGVGMSDQTQARVFEPFFTTKEVGKGTGLGLATCYGIVRQHGGRIEVASRPGKGSTFRVYLPRVLASRPEPAPPPELAGTVLPTGTETILVVEDEEPVRQVMVRALRLAGYTVLETANAREALPLGEHYDGPIHMLITDVVMPGGGGRDLADRLKAARPEMEALFISGYTGEGDLDEDAGAGGGHFLSKPFTPADLARMVREILDARAALDGPASAP